MQQLTFSLFDSHLLVTPLTSTDRALPVLDQSRSVFDNIVGTADEFGGQMGAVLNCESVPTILNNSLSRAGNNSSDGIETIPVTGGSVDDVPWTNRVIVDLSHNTVGDSAMSFVDMLMAVHDRIDIVFDE